MEDIKENLVDILKLKNVIAKIKNSMDGLNI